MPLDTLDLVVVCILEVVVDGSTVMTVVSALPSSDELLDVDAEEEVVTGAEDLVTGADEGPEETPDDEVVAADETLVFAPDETPDVTAPLPPELCPTIAPAPHGTALPSGCVACGAGTCDRETLYQPLLQDLGKGPTATDSLSTCACNGEAGSPSRDRRAVVAESYLKQGIRVQLGGSQSSKARAN